ncbi:MAG: hypothetical protein ACRDQU_08980 [Pseudonocardiaceae bacterium]
MTDPKPPRGTGPAGKRMWAAVTGNFELEAHELLVLAQIVTVADRITSLDVAVTRDGVLLGDRVHPALIESRLQRVALGRLLAVLRLSDQDEQRPQRRGGYRRPYRLRQVVGSGHGSA